jgi:hypothetical protein
LNIKAQNYKVYVWPWLGCCPKYGPKQIKGLLTWTVV